MKDHVDQILSRFEHLTERLTDETVLSDPNQYKKLAKERSDMEDVVVVAKRLRDVYKTIDEDEAVVKAGGDPELVSMAKAEIDELEGERGELEEKFKFMLVPRDPSDSKNTILEIRAGTGGEEANLFVADLMRMYVRYAEMKGWKIDVLTSNPTGIGGFKEVIFIVEGKNAYGTLKFERGVHRVQRVPVTEASGRIHTSAVSVAVLPEAEEVEVQIDPKDLRIDVFRSSGPGGQNVNKVETAVRVTHIPSGIVVSCQDEKSQHKNKEKALKVLRARLLEKAEQEQQEKISQERKSQIGSGDRSAKIRTYNYPQQRVTDHRIGFTAHRLGEILDGDLDEMINALVHADAMEKIKK
ncbi:MAG: peptide chain release factor 1 [Candidatus Krumholzibacteriota bacterium]|nr:peptide chain release factor 1 [Candidatus Krumholzibacteriota bacterium]